MIKWDKKTFIKHLRETSSREVAKIGVRLIEFSEKYSDDISWGRGEEHGTMTFRCESDFGYLPLFHLSSDGRINLQINFLRSKDNPPMVLRDLIRKLEAIFLYDFDAEMYPVDTYEGIEDMFHTRTQVDKFMKTVESAAYRLKQ